MVFEQSHVAPSITGLLVVFIIHSLCISFYKSFYLYVPDNGDIWVVSFTVRDVLLNVFEMTIFPCQD